ncbi:MAG: hypothetical protein QNJ72_03180 [Pleurocapsa sp. MO_226.B13]|nr:hypothetical protein [Pleurocapsa sp. MO_226.B13]
MMNINSKLDRINILNFEDTNFIYDPYPVGLARQVFEKNYYEKLVNTFPPQELFSFMRLLGNKYSLSEKNNPRQYHDYVMSCESWREFYQWVKSESFIVEILELLCQHHINLGLLASVNGKILGDNRGVKYRLKALLKSLKRSISLSSSPSLSARFEFSMLPAQGGHIKPHTDAPNKFITLVIPIVRENEWNVSFGGATEIMKPKNITQNFNYLNKQLEFDEVETVKSFDYSSNQCLIFIKTFNSLHAVRPMKGKDSNLMRSTLTINIESKL